MKPLHARWLEPARAEIAATHDFIAAWFRGDADETDFDRQLRRRFVPALTNIQPAGRTLTASELLDDLQGGFAANPGFDIAIADVSLIAVFEQQGETFLFAVYTEHQTGARNSNPPENSRRSTVLLRHAGEPAHFEWLHIHETALPV